MQVSAIAGEFTWRDMKRRAKELDDISPDFSPVHQADGYLSASPRSSRHSQLRGVPEEEEEEEEEKEHPSSCNDD